MSVDMSDLECRRCHGMGTINAFRQGEDGASHHQSRRCDMCAGSGWRQDEGDRNIEDVGSVAEAEGV